MEVSPLKPRFACIAAASVLSCVDAVAADFGVEIGPLLEEKCLECHNENNRKGKVSLATAEDVFSGEHGKTLIKRGDADASLLIEVVSKSGADIRPEMPKEGVPLTVDEVSALRAWINDGASWPDGQVLREKSKADKNWWSYQPIEKSSGNMVEAGVHPVDAFIVARLEREGLVMNPPADRRSFIRRATYDLTGLPPTPDAVAAYVADTDPHADQKLIDRLLGSPHYGERWGRHWLDVVRFGESRGYERNEIINDAWPFRDYVIDSLNCDKPFDQFIREHLAGDVFGAGDPAVEIGSAFLVAGPYDDVGNQDAVQAAQIRANTIDEMIRATSESFLGLTVGCARCHDHKFDPITTSDYYALYATFAGVRHGSRELAATEERAARDRALKPLQARLAELDHERRMRIEEIVSRGAGRAAEYSAQWHRPSVDRTGTEERFDPVQARYVRLVCEAQDQNPDSNTGFRIDEFEIWTAGAVPENVALASSGAEATGASRNIEDFPGAYGPQLAIDGKTGAAFIAASDMLTIELASPQAIDRVVFSSAKGLLAPEYGQFTFVADYRIEVSVDGSEWREVAHGRDRRPANDSHRDRRYRQGETTSADRAHLSALNRERANLKNEIAAIPALSTAWMGMRSEDDAKGPFAVFLGGSPQRRGNVVVPASLSPLDGTVPGYRLEGETGEGERRRALAEWITRSDHPLTARVLANRVWHYHFGAGLVDTPNDFGYMGGQPSHPGLLDFLARQLVDGGWRLKSMHRLIMTSKAYRQSSAFRQSAARIDGDARLLWRFPPRRLSAEELRDSLLISAGKLDVVRGGPGFRLFQYLQDNVATYLPLDQHGPETYRRAVYHQNARASRVDLMTDFDQPDCAFSSPKRAETTTPLQALTMLNHSFSVDMAEALAERLRTEAGEEPRRQIQRAFEIVFQRPPDPVELGKCEETVRSFGLRACCRSLFNSSEFVHLD